ncbi:hypothetical protein R3I94_017888 [Phoxinus phoxinus]
MKREENQITLIHGSVNERFRDRLKLDEETGSLTITNTRTTDSGLYKVIIKNDGTQLNIFNITVYARLPVPVIIRISVLSSISVCDLSISLSLPLEVEYQDKNTYSCVLNNPISNQTTHLEINTLCHTCDQDLLYVYMVLISAVAATLLIIAGFGIFWICRKHRKTNQEVQTRGEDITYADPTFYKRKAHKSILQEEDEVVYAGVAVRR